MQATIYYFMIMLFVISTIFTLVFMTNIDDEVIPLGLRRRLMFPLYFGFTYIIASLSDNSMGMVMMAYVPAVVAIVFSDWKTALVVAIAKPLINSMYLHTRYLESEIPYLWVSVLSSWAALLILSVAFYRYRHSRVFYVIMAMGLGILEDTQAFFYPTDFRGAHIALAVNVISYMIILWFATGLKERLRNYQQSISDQLFRDSLTNVYNLKAFNEGKTNNPDDNPYVIGVVDVDKFKHLNDTLGHSAGNTVIQLMANALTDTMDVHFPDDKDGKAPYRVFRFGGEEFVVVAMYDGDLNVGMTELKVALDEANNAFDKSVQETFNLTASFSGGITSSESHERGYDSFRHADGLLYQMKRSTPGQVAVDGQVLDK